jgi:outer membrane receptor protein involved in Fe transport
MRFNKCTLSLSVAAACALLSTGADAAKPMPANMEEMWKIIQQQQKEIEALKAKAGENESLKKEVKELKASQQETAPQAYDETAPASAKGKSAKSEAERKTEVLATEVEKLKTKLFIPDKKEYKSQYGLGPAASEVYRVNRGLSIGGYGEWFYTNYTGDKGSKKDTFDAARAVLYVGYKFNDWIILNNEFEFEHGSTGEGDEKKGEVSVEFSQLDFLLHPAANIRAGLMLVPMGFINEIHEPTTYHGNRRPDVERYIIPSTWREMGAGLFGEVLPGLQYRMYAMNGLNAKGFESIGIREGRQGGSEGLADNFAFTGRVDYAPPYLTGLLVGASAYVGDSGQDQLYLGRKVNAFTQLYEGHVQWHYKGLEFRALGAYGHIGDAAALSAAKGETIGSENYGWYTEAAYDIMPMLWKDGTQYLAPFVRYEQYDTLAGVPTGFTKDGSYDRWIYQAGLTYKPIPNISIKADYRNIHSSAGQMPDELNLGVGFIY